MNWSGYNDKVNPLKNHCMSLQVKEVKGSMKLISLGTFTRKVHYSEKQGMIRRPEVTTLPKCKHSDVMRIAHKV